MYQGFALDAAAVIQAVVDSGLMVSLMTVKEPPSTLTETGAQKDLSDYITVSGLSNIQCLDAPDNLGSSFSAWEKSNPDLVGSTARRHVLLNGYYPQFSPSTNWGDAGWIAVVTNTNTGETRTYDIRGAESDSQQTQTRVSLRAVTV